MIALSRQARNLVFCFILLASLSTPAQAMETYESRTQANVGAKGAGGNKVLSVGDVFDSIGHSLSDLVPTSDRLSEMMSASSTSGKSSEKTEQTTATQPSKTIAAKRLDEMPAATATATANAQPAAAPPPPPYKVYAAPIIAQEPVVDEPTLTSTGQRVAKPALAQKDSPLPPESYLKDNLEEIIINPPSTGVTLKAKPAAPPVSARFADVPPAAALPKQFFPIFPLGAADETQAQLLPIASNIELEADHSQTARAILSIHDIQRNSAEAVATLMTLSGSEGGRDLILAPQFSLDIDIMRFAQHLPEQGQSVSRWTLDDPWQFGGDSVLPHQKTGISSFTALDILLLFLADKERFPSLTQIIIVGHGIGADFVQRYAALGQAPDVLAKDRLPVRFVVANPSSYLYMTPSRPVDGGTRFASPKEVKDCPKMNAYPYGLEGLLSYGKRFGANAIRMRYPERRVIYLAGGKITTDNLLDRGCEASIQGKDRLTRAKLYGRYISQSFGDEAATTQSFTIVPKAGYDPVALLGSPCGMKALFGDGTCKEADNGF